MTTAISTPNRMYIDGEWASGSEGETVDIVNPADEQVIDAVPKATAQDVDRALAAAGRAWKEWREEDAWTRCAALRRVAAWVRERADTIANVLTEEQGKTIPECLGEINAAADQFDWYADEARRIYVASSTATLAVDLSPN